jgi:hypothetical protein
MQLYLKFRFRIRISLIDGIGLEASVLLADISPLLSSSIRLYRSKSLLFISDFLYSIEISGLEGNILHP